MITKILKKAKNSTISSLFAGIVVIMAMFMTVACEKDETNVTDQQQSVRKPQSISDMEVMQYLPEVVDGRLVFKDSVAFDKVITWIAKSQDNPNRIENMFSSLHFKSMNAVFYDGYQLLQLQPNTSQEDALKNVEKFTEYLKNYPHVFYQYNGKDYTDYMMQASNVISYIVNEYGIFQVGKSIYRITYTKSYEILDGDTNKIPLVIDNSGENLTDYGIIVTEFSELGNKAETKEYPPVYFDNRHRCIITFHLSYISSKYYYDLQVRGQEKIVFWFNGMGFNAICEMNQSSSYWKIGSTVYDWHDANIWKYTFDHYNKTFTVIVTPSSTAINNSLSYMPYQVACRHNSSDPYSYWNCSNVFGNGEGWNN